MATYLVTRPDGRFMVQIPVVEDEGKLRLIRKGEKLTRYYRQMSPFPDRRQSERYAQQRVADILNGQVERAAKGPAGLTLAQWSEVYFNDPVVRKQRSLHFKQSYHLPTILTVLGEKPLAKINKQDVQSLRDYLAQRPNRHRPEKRLSISTINAHHGVLSAMLELALERGVLEHNVAHDVKVPDPKNARDRILEPGEFEKLLDALLPYYRLPVKVAYLYGPRKNEVLSRRANYDLAGGWLKLPKELCKNGEARKMKLRPELLAELRLHAATLPADCPWMFINPKNGKRLNIRPSVFESAVERAGIEDFHFHDLRHCAATNMRRAGVETNVVMAICGWKSIAMYRRYDAIRDCDLERAVEKLNTIQTPALYAVPAPLQDQAVATA